MLNVAQFGAYLEQLGFKSFSGVPCSYLSPLINYAINENKLIMANNEGDAVAIASGVSLAGMRRDEPYFGCVLMQNSGLSNALSPLTSLNHTFGIPILGFVSLRGQRDEQGRNTDEPQHELLGVITDKLLETCEIPYLFLSVDMAQAFLQLKKAQEILKKGSSFFFIVKNNTFECMPLSRNSDPSFKHTSPIHQSLTTDIFPKRLEALEILHALGREYQAILLATTGKTGRELYEIGDTPNQLYMVGSMGCVGSLGLGIALQVNQKVIAIDGDSALLMRLGALSTNAYYARQKNWGNFCHILLDNQSHDSTGGQFNLSGCVDFAQIAHACGYEVCVTKNIEEFKNAVLAFLRAHQGGARLIILKIAKGSKAHLGRPKITPKEVALRMAEYLFYQ